jgi:signal transduction histidine kinase
MRSLAGRGPTVMMLALVGSPDSVRGGIASSDPERVRAAIRALSKKMKKRPHDERVAAAELIVPLASHPSERVRQAVADACAWIPGPDAEGALAKLREDDDGFVQNAALDASKGRTTALKKTLPRDDPKDVRTRELLDEIAREHSKSARMLAARAVWHREDYLIRRIQHELGNVLGAAVLSVDVARHENRRRARGNDTVDTHLAEADERIARARSMLLSFQRYATIVKVDFQDDDLFDVLEEARGIIPCAAGRRERLVFSNAIAPGTNAEIDRTCLLLALQNLLKNAVEAYADDGAPIEITASTKVVARSNVVELAISDRGPGMTENAKNGLFVPFFSKKDGGTGFGLLTALRMVEDVHGGSFDIESEPGRGTTVTMRLPIEQAPKKKASARRA